jgi:hypothetical protein
MIEIIVERWTSLQGRIDHLWSVWRDGKRTEMGGPHPSAEDAETAAREYCMRQLKALPDRVTRL